MARIQKGGGWLVGGSNNIWEKEPGSQMSVGNLGKFCFFSFCWGVNAAVNISWINERIHFLMHNRLFISLHIIGLILIIFGIGNYCSLHLQP